MNLCLVDERFLDWVCAPIVISKAVKYCVRWIPFPTNTIELHGVEIFLYGNYINKLFHFAQRFVFTVLFVSSFEIFYVSLFHWRIWEILYRPDVQQVIALFNFFYLSNFIWPGHSFELMFQSPTCRFKICKYFL